MSRRIVFLAAAALLSLGTLAARPASAADESSPEGEEDLRQKIQKQMEKILQLMRENEEALLVASTGGKAAPKSPEVDVPAGEESKGGEAGEEKAPAGGDPGARGEEIRRRIEEVLTGSGSKSRAIPRELEELVKMIPT